MRETYKNVEVLRKTPARGSWRAAYAVRGENGRAKIEEERISMFALCEDEGGRRFVSGVREDGELCVMREDFVGHFSAKEGRHKVRDEAERFVRTREQEKGRPI